MNISQNASTFTSWFMEGLKQSYNGSQLEKMARLASKFIEFPPNGTETFSSLINNATNLTAEIPPVQALIPKENLPLPALNTSLADYLPLLSTPLTQISLGTFGLHIGLSFLDENLAQLSTLGISLGTALSYYFEQDPYLSAGAGFILGAVQYRLTITNPSYNERVKKISRLYAKIAKTSLRMSAGAVIRNTLSTYLPSLSPHPWIDFSIKGAATLCCLSLLETLTIGNTQEGALNR